MREFSESLSLESARRANEGLMLAEMFRQLEKSSAPVHLVDQLKEYRDAAWQALNSYAHGGIHPISRTVTGYPPQFSVDVLCKPDVLVASRPVTRDPFWVPRT